jgi:hypothetical protein
VFTSPLGAPLRNSNFRRQVWYAAVERADLPQGLRMTTLVETPQTCSLKLPTS